MDSGRRVMQTCTLQILEKYFRLSKWISLHILWLERCSYVAEHVVNCHRGRYAHHIDNKSITSLLLLKLERKLAQPSIDLWSLVKSLPYDGKGEEAKASDQHLDVSSCSVTNQKNVFLADEIPFYLLPVTLEKLLENHRRALISSGKFVLRHISVHV